MNTTKIGKYTISYNNPKEFHLLKSEIFGDNCYSISLEKESPYIIDIGSYIGMSVIYFKGIYPDSKILSFEPNPQAREILKENIFQNNLDNVEVLPYAIDSSEGKRDFFFDSSKENWQSTGGFLENSWNGEYKNNTKTAVETKKLSEYLLAPVDILKMDIEGAEYRVLKESENLLKNVKAVVLEYHPVNKKCFSLIINILKKSGFSISIFEDGKENRNPDSRKLLIIKGYRV